MCHSVLADYLDSLGTYANFKGILIWRISRQSFVAYTVLFI